MWLAHLTLHTPFLWEHYTTSGHIWVHHTGYHHFGFLSFSLLIISCSRNCYWAGQYKRLTRCCTRFAKSCAARTSLCTFWQPVSLVVKWRHPWHRLTACWSTNRKSGMQKTKELRNYSGGAKAPPNNVQKRTSAHPPASMRGMGRRSISTPLGFANL